MDEEYTIMSVEHPEETAWGFIGNNLDDYNRQNAGELNFQRLCYALYSSDMQIVGGVLGEIYWDWLHLDLLWIKEELRGHGYGHRLLQAIEEEAKRRGVKSIFLDTFSFQAPHFYDSMAIVSSAICRIFRPGIIATSSQSLFSHFIVGRGKKWTHRKTTYINSVNC